MTFTSKKLLNGKFGQKLIYSGRTFIQGKIAQGEICRRVTFTCVISVGDCVATAAGDLYLVGLCFRSLLVRCMSA